jgi:hypothetical protein
MGQKNNFFKVAQTQQTQKSKSNADVVGAFNTSSMLSDVELHQELQSFADRYIQRIMQISDDVSRESSDLQEREIFKQFKASAGSSAVSIAIEPDPLHALRDMRVMVRLQHLVWKNGGPNGVNPERAARVQRILAKLEDQINSIASRVIPSDAMLALDERINVWYQANPDQTSVAFIRFHNLDTVDSKLDSMATSTGLLAPVAEAVREMSEARKLADRALFLTNHMPMLMEWRSELLAQRVLGSPEAIAYLKESQSIRDTLQDLLQESSNMRKTISAERQAVHDEMELYRPLLKQFVTSFDRMPDRIAQERASFFNSLNAESSNIQPTLAKLYEVTAAFRDASASLEAYGKRGMSPQQMSDTLDKMLTLTSHSTNIINSLESLLKNKDNSNLNELNQRLIEHEHRIFGYSVALLVLAALLILLVRYLWLRMSYRKKPTIN